MKCKSLMIAIIAVLSCFMASAQAADKKSIVIANEDSCKIESIQAAIDACLMLAESAESKDEEALLKAKEAMEECRLAPFGALRQVDKSDDGSLEGHLVFNVAFADSLAQGKDPYKDADHINKREAHRGQMENGQIMTKTILIKANGKSTYKFTSHDRQELAVVAEPGGRITTRVHAVNENKGINEWHNDTSDVAKGRNSRKTAFTLPHSPRSQVTLEIANCTNKDISVVVISN